MAFSLALLALTGGLAYVVYLFIRIIFMRQKLPPGPFPLPIVGNALSIRPSLLQYQFYEMSQKYGRIFSIWMGPKLQIVLNDFDIVKEAFQKQGEIFSDRPNDFLFEVLLQGGGIVGANGEFWKEQRRFSLHLLRDLGFGKVVLEERIAEIAKNMMNEIRKHKNEPFEYRWMFTKTICNVISSIVFNRTYAYDHKESEHFFVLLEENLKNLSPAMNALPWVRFIPGDPFKYGMITRNMDECFAFIDDRVAERRLEFDGTNVECFIDAYLTKMEQEKGNPNTTFTEHQCTRLIANLFIAGTDTTATTLRWALLYMAYYPEYQERARREIYKEIGKERIVSTRDKTKLPFVEACLNEAMRVRPVSPFGVPHLCTKDTTLDGYFIPAKTTIIASAFSIFHNPHFFKNPDLFDPLRFFDENNNTVKRIDQLIPFSTGRRVCIGESLARMELLIFFTTILQHFRFNLPGSEKPSLASQSGLMSKPILHEFIVEPLDE